MRKLNGEAIVAEITLKEQAEGGYIALTSDGEGCFVSSKVVSQNGMKAGDSLTGALVPHRWSESCQWFAEWVVPTRLCTATEVWAAYKELERGGAVLAVELGIHEGDILFHAGLAQKIVGFDRKKDLDAGEDIAYTLELRQVLDDATYDPEEE